MDAPVDFEGLCKLGRRALRQRKAKEALQFFEQARLINDSNADVHESLGTAHFIAGTYDEAIKHFQLVQRIEPRRSSAFVNLGATYNRKGEYQKAIEVLRRCVSVDKKCSEAYYNIGIAYRKLKQPALAVPAYKEAIRLNPQMADAYLNLGNAYAEMNNLQQAIIHFKRALEIDPEFEKAKRGLADAEAAALAGKNAISPFGRLVSDQDLAAASTAAVRVRNLSEAERIGDRTALQEIHSSLKLEMQGLYQLVQDELDPAIKMAVRALSESSEMFSAQETLKQAADEFRASRKRVDSVIKNLREHEEKMR